MPEVDFTPEKVKKLRRYYDRAVRAGDDEFVFEGNQLLVGYAKYLLEYLEGKMRAND
jgi:hypothetical protein